MRGIANANDVILILAIVFVALIAGMCIVIAINSDKTKSNLFLIAYHGINGANVKLGSIQNIVSFLSIVIAVLAILGTCAINKQNEKKSNLEISIVDGHKEDWGAQDPYYMLPSTSEKEKRQRVLPFTFDEDGCFCFLACQPLSWGVRITNSGNTTAKNVIIELSFEHFSFSGASSIEDYELNYHYHGLGTYKCISRMYDNIQPNTSIVLPQIPLFALTEKEEKSDYDIPPQTSLVITLYEDNAIQKEFVFPCKYYDEDDFPQLEGCSYSFEKDMWEFELKMNLLKDSVQGNEYGYFAQAFSYTDCKRIIEEHPEIPVLDYKRIYVYYLDKLDAYNSSERQNAQSNCVFYGRLYYLSLREEDIEFKINNDISSYSKVDMSS